MSHFVKKFVRKPCGQEGHIFKTPVELNHYYRLLILPLHYLMWHMTCPMAYHLVGMSSGFFGHLGFYFEIFSPFHCAVLPLAMTYFKCYGSENVNHITNYLYGL